jgi:hypothetical protein
MTCSTVSEPTALPRATCCNVTEDEELSWNGAWLDPGQCEWNGTEADISHEFDVRILNQRWMDGIYVYFTDNITMSFTINGSQFGNSLFFDQARPFAEIGRAPHEQLYELCALAHA